MRKEFSISQIQSFRNCRKAWEYRYVEGLQPKTPPKPLYIGSTIHKLLELREKEESWKDYLYNVVEPTYDAMSEDNRMALGEDFIECLDKIMQQYDWCYRDEDLKYLAVELPISYKIKGSKYFIGVADAIVEDRNGEQWLVEHKTFSSKKMSSEQTWINAQTALYMKILNEKGYNIKGVIWDMIKTSAPEPPKVLKNGEFGKQYGTTTILSFIWAGYKIEDLSDEMFESIRYNHLNFLERYKTPIMDNVLDIIWNDFIMSVNEICKNKSCPRTLSKDCDYCSYKDICKVEMTGGDIANIKQLLFTSRLERELASLNKYQSENAGQCDVCKAKAKEAQFDLNNEWCIANCKLYQESKKEVK